MKPHAPFALERFDKEKTLEIQTNRWQKDSLKGEIIVDFFWIDSLEGWLKRGDN